MRETKPGNDLLITLLRGDCCCLCQNKKPTKDTKQTEPPWKPTVKKEAKYKRKQNLILTKTKSIKGLFIEG